MESGFTPQASTTRRSWPHCSRATSWSSYGRRHRANRPHGSEYLVDHLTAEEVPLRVTDPGFGGIAIKAGTVEADT